jgi:hypothetical protein
MQKLETEGVEGVQSTCVLPKLLIYFSKTKKKMTSTSMKLTMRAKIG